LLTSLDISVCFINPTVAFRAICENCRFITKLNVSDCSTLSLSVDTVKLIMGSLLLLTDFQFAGCSQTTKLACYCLLQQKFQSITQLDFQHSRVIGTLYDYHPHLSFDFPTTSDSLYDYVAHIMFNKCINLSMLALTGPLASSSILLFNIPCLTTLVLYDTDCIFDYHIVALGKSLVSLLTFEIHGCKWITSTAVVALCYSSPQLKVCILDGFGVQHSRIGDSALLNGVSKLRNLRKLSLFKLSLVSTVGFLAVVRSCLKLNDVNVSLCSGLSAVQVGAILSSYNVLNSCLFSD
jgi:hypothetical protein